MGRGGGEMGGMEFGMMKRKPSQTWGKNEISSVVEGNKKQFLYCSENKRFKGHNVPVKKKALYARIVLGRLFVEKFEKIWFTWLPPSCHHVT
jgi:hypothetical protein